MGKLNLKNYQDEIEDKPGISMIKFGAAWCGPCRAYAPIWRETAKSVNEVNDTINFYEVDVDQEPELSAKFKVSSIPATLILRDGKVEKNLIGLHNKSTIIEVLNSI